MSVAVTAARPAPLCPATVGRPAPRVIRPQVPAEPVTVTVTVDGSGAGRERVLAALRDLVAAAGTENTVSFTSDGSLCIDTATRSATRDGVPLDLSRLEYDLLLFLARHPRQVFTRSQLLTQVWGHTHTTNRTVDVHVSRLRTKLLDQDLITTVYGIGYRLGDDAAITVRDAAGVSV
jgi:DNA-binding winged helix-turn-helix (wHTH) protein